jgi:ribose transport system permease protein
VPFASSARSSAAVDARPRRRRQGTSRRVVSAAAAYQSGGLFLALLLLGVFFSSSSSEFLTSSNFSVILLQAAPVGLIAIPAGMLLLAGYIDLSVGAVAWLCAGCFGLLSADLGWALAPAMLGAILVGMAWGTMNGYLTAFLGASPVVVTLGGFAGARGLGDALTHDVTRTGFGETFSTLGNGHVGSLPTPAVIFVGVFLVAVYLWYGTPLGRHLTAIGADSGAARAVGVSVRAIPMWVYVASGGMAALSALLITAQLDAASPALGIGLELQVLTAVLLGGVAFSGGRGSLWGVLFGVLFVAVLNNGLILLNVGPYFVNVAVGAVLLLVAVIDVAYQRLERLPAAPADGDPGEDRRDREGVGDLVGGKA